MPAVVVETNCQPLSAKFTFVKFNISISFVDIFEIVMTSLSRDNLEVMYKKNTRTSFTCVVYDDTDPSKSGNRYNITIQTTDSDNIIVHIQQRHVLPLRRNIFRQFVNALCLLMGEYGAIKNHTSNSKRSKRDQMFEIISKSMQYNDKDTGHTITLAVTFNFDALITNKDNCSMKKALSNLIIYNNMMPNVVQTHSDRLHAVEWIIDTYEPLRFDNEVNRLLSIVLDIITQITVHVNDTLDVMQLCKFFLENIQVYTGGKKKNTLSDVNPSSIFTTRKILTVICRLYKFGCVSDHIIQQIEQLDHYMCGDIIVERKWSELKLKVSGYQVLNRMETLSLDQL